MEEALGAFDRAAALNPDNPTTLNNRATALARLGRYAEAARGFEAVCTLEPAFKQAAFFAAASYSMAGEPGAAARWARYCLDHGLAKAAQFAQDPLFVGLRNSAFWDAARGEPRAGAQ
jgi:tetratricopeptide (TPR) repeat protein